MPYTLPSTRIYQLLEKSGGAARVTPDLDAVFIGTLNNVVGMAIDKNKARSIEFAKWPSGGVTPPPVDPVDPPTPVVVPFAITKAYWIGGTTSDATAIYIEGTSPASIGANFSVSITGTADYEWEGDPIVNLYPQVDEVFFNYDTRTGVWYCTVVDPVFKVPTMISWPDEVYDVKVTAGATILTDKLKAVQVTADDNIASVYTGIEG